MEGIMSAADIAAVTNRGYGYGDGFGGFGGNGLWLFAILALMWGGFGGNNRFGNPVDGRCATVEDVNNTANFTRLESQVRANENSILSAATNLGNGICSLGYENAQNFGDLKYDLATKTGDLSAQIAACCCENKQIALENRYLAAQNTAAINATTTAQTQKILDAIAQNKIEALQGRVNQLELQNAVAGVVRYPNGMTYSAGTSPFCNCNPCGCGCGNI